MQPIQGMTDREMDDLRRQMLRFAQQQLQNDGLAEDAVQEALLGALRNREAFAGKAAYKTWVFAILKNKIVDQLRQGRRFESIEGASGDVDEEGEVAAHVFDQQGHWLQDESPRRWGNPEETLKSTQFWKVFEICLDQLPGKQGRVFMMREFIELDTEEICETVGLSMTNLNVILYRARMRLRLCLEQRWFAAAQ
ncbi:MAG: sigma-70 family RNA polymerase sigma factor [Betaproteobacteria bacterium]|jgi:RNA polymerase, sigma-24 subunit, RpoE|nr:sigma-70 family RNA polymerase sigma factor [Betaproteobacteria bacterium]